MVHCFPIARPGSWIPPARHLPDATCATRLDVLSDETCTHSAAARCAQKTAQAAELAARAAWLWLCLVRGDLHRHFGRRRFPGLAGLARSARLREPRTLRAAG